MSFFSSIKDRALGARDTVEGGKRPGRSLAAWANLAVLLSAAIWIVVSLGRHVFGFLLMNSEGRVQYIPDDAYYYLVLARNFANMGTWTFDDGVSETTGFHLLHGYVLALLYRLFQPDPAAFEVMLVVLSTVLVFGGVAVGIAVSFRSRSTASMLLLCLMGTSIMVERNQISGMEWPWVVLVSIVYVVLLSGYRVSNGKVACGLIFCTGLLGSLARSDFGLYPALLALAAICVHVLHRDRLFLYRALSGFFGACAGVLVVFAHCYVVSGNFIQSSARMKSYWPHDPAEAFTQTWRFALEFFGEPGGLWSPTPFLVLLLIMISFLAGAIQIRERARGDAGPYGRMNWALGEFLVLWLASLAAAGLYLAFYSQSAVVQPWYTANFAVPLFLGIAAPFLGARAFSEREMCMCFVVAVLLLRQFALGSQLEQYVGWKWQILGKRAGEYLRGLPEGELAGSWNAGIVSYYSGRAVVNLDGLVNDDVFSYARSNTLPRYIDEKGIRYIVDFERMLDEDYRKRGGYDDPDFLARLRLLKATPKVSDHFRAMCIFELVPAGQAPPTGDWIPPATFDVRAGEIAPDAPGR